LHIHASVIPAGFDPKQAHVAAQWPAERPVVCCRFEPAGRFVFCGLESSVVQRFNLADGSRVAFPGGHDSWVFSLAFSGDGEKTYTGGGDGRVTVWETAASAPQPVRQIEAHHGWIRAMSVSPDGLLLATGGNDRVVRTWETSSGKPVGELKGHAGHVYSLEFHPNGKTLLSGDLLGVIHAWDLASGRSEATFDAGALHSYNTGQQVDFGGVRGLAITPDGKLVAAGGLHKATNPLGAVHEPVALLFEGESHKNVRTLRADDITRGTIWRLRFLADGTLLGAGGGGNGGFLLFWKADADKDYHRFVLPNILRDMDLHPDGLRVATAHYDGNLRITRLAAKTG
jgi:WD40 repeat protein